MEYMCHKWSRICFTCRNHFPVLTSFMTYQRVCISIYTTGATSWARTACPSGASVLVGVRVTRSLVLCVCFVDRCLFFCPFSFDHCVVCSSSIYWFWLPLWYLQTRITTCNMNVFFSLICLWLIYQNVSNSYELWNNTRRRDILDTLILGCSCMASWYNLFISRLRVRQSNLFNSKNRGMNITSTGNMHTCCVSGRHFFY